MRRYKDLLQKSTSTSLQIRRGSQAKLKQSHNRLLGELRHTKLQLSEVKSSEKTLKAKLDEATRNAAELRRELQLLKLRGTSSHLSDKRRSTGRTRLRSQDTESTAQHSRANLSAQSVSSLDSSSVEEDIDELDQSSRSIRSEPARNLKAYERYHKLKQVYMDRYAS